VYLPPLASTLSGPFVKGNGDAGLVLFVDAGYLLGVLIPITLCPGEEMITGEDNSVVTHVADGVDANVASGSSVSLLSSISKTAAYTVPVGAEAGEYHLT
jgi:hypothetical protein